MTRRPPPPPAAPRGFTLAELLIALSLTLMLIGAVYTALDLHWIYSTAGRDDMERQQLVRAVFSRMDRDLRSAVYQAPPPAEEESSTSGTTATGGTGTSGSSGQSSTSGSGTGSAGSTSSGSATSGSSSGSSSSSSSSSTSSTTMVENPMEQSTGSTPGLFGNANTLLVHCSRPSAATSYVAVNDGGVPGSRIGDLHSIGYFVGGEGGGSLGTGVSGGLARLAGDRLAMMFADTQGDAGALGSAIEVLAPEVTSIQFRYFDGTAWQTEWDSVTMGGLPFSVEIQLSVTMLANQTAGGGGVGSRRRGPVTTTHRLVVPIPSARLPESTTTSSTETAS